MKLASLPLRLLLSSSSDNDGGEGSRALPIFELAILLVAVGLLFGALTRYFQISSKLPVPYTVIVLVIGIILGILGDHLDRLGDAAQLVQRIDPHFLLAAFIPGLIFESAFNTNFHIVNHEFSQALLLAGPGVLINTALTATFVHYAIPYGWDWSQCVMFGSIASATDPVAVVALLAELGASKRLATLVEGESLLNDGTAFVLYMISLQFVQGNNPYVIAMYISLI